MRIGAFARAARTTPRTVRHYHSLGLLPEPRRLANGYREYELADLVRLMRVTWLARAGVPLSRIGELLAGEDASVADDRLRRDLDVIAETLTAERDRLDRQLGVLGEINESLASGRRLSGLPRELDDALDRVARAGDSRTAALAEQEREMLQILALAGDLPSEMVDGYVAMAADPPRLREALHIMAAYADLAGRPVRESEAAIDDLVERMAQHPVVLELLTSSGATDEALAASDAEFFLPDDAQREVAIRLLARLT